jgi:hypothetical protein
MAYKNTIAKNHLSNESKLASKGRYGDTEIARTSKGELWHVNPKEKALMSMYGMKGEKMVDAAGSGTINPETGLKENFLGLTLAAWTAIGAIASAGVGIYSAWKGGSERRQQASSERKSAETGLALLDTSEENLGKAAETGIRQEELTKETNVAIAQTNLPYSGTVQEKRSTMWNAIQGRYERGKGGLTAGLGKDMGEIEGWFEGEKARITSERARLIAQGNLSKDVEESWYLGRKLETGSFSG